MKSACLKDDKRVEIISRNNSLCAKGRISVVSHAEPNTLFQPAIHVVQLGMVLRCFAEGWNRIHPHFFGIKLQFSGKFLHPLLQPTLHIVCRVRFNLNVRIREEVRLNFQVTLLERA